MTLLAPRTAHRAPRGVRLVGGLLGQRRWPEPSGVAARIATLGVVLSLRADDVRNLPAPQRRCGFGLTATLIGRGVPVFVAAAALLELLPRTKPRAACLMGAGMLVMLRVEQRPGAAEELARTGDLPASEPDEEQFLACDGRNIPKGVDVHHLMDVQFAAEGDSDPVLRDGRTRREPNRNSRAFGGNEGLRP